MNPTSNEIIMIKGLDGAREYLNQKMKNEMLLIEADFELERLIESHDLIAKHLGLNNCIELIKSVESSESEYGSRMGVEYKKSSENPQDKALMLCDDGEWVACLHLNFELDDSKFINIQRLKQAVTDMQSCQNTKQ